MYERGLPGSLSWQVDPNCADSLSVHFHIQECIFSRCGAVVVDDGLDSDGRLRRDELAADARLVDVSSGVESAPGVKDPNLISGFLRTVKAL